MNEKAATITILKLIQEKRLRLELDKIAYQFSQERVLKNDIVTELNRLSDLSNWVRNNLSMKGVIYFDTHNNKGKL